MLSTVALNGSRCMMIAVRNAPIRTVERNINRIAAVVAKLRVTSQIQFSAECGMFHVCAVNAIATRLVNRARAGEGPAFLQADTYRYSGHHVGDINRDGRPDFVVCSKYSGILAWFENDGRGRFTEHRIHEDQSAYEVRLVDMNGDCALDILVAGQESQNVVWYENRLLASPHR